MTERSADCLPAIRVLPAVVADQIAAGEVVTRPASVVKELVDNAIDARASRISVEIATGGTTLVAVTDDGHGMAEADARLCILRHATSKIRTADELVAIRTLGFRGEALPSIASVSRLRLRTRRAQDAEGTELVLEAGQLVQVGPCGCARGCTVEVRDLFYNVPARRKFLRALSTESAQITETLVEAALGYPALAITLVRDGRTARRLPACPSRLERVSVALGDEQWILAAGERGPLKVDAYLGRPERARAGAAGLRFVVNGRPVADRLLARAIAAAFGETLGRGHYPIGVVYVELPAELVDVNVHPQKAEVRFAHARAVTDAVHSVVRPAILQALGLPATATGPSGAAQPSGRALRVAEDAPAGGAWSWAGSGKVEPATAVASRGSEWKSGGQLDAAARATAPTTPSVEPRSASPTASGDGVPAEPLPRLLGRLRNGCLVFETMAGLTVIDPSAARRAARQQALEQTALPIDTTPLMFPIMRDVSPALGEKIEPWTPLLGAHGIELRPSGPHTIALLAVPAGAAVTDAELLLDAIVRWIDAQPARSDREAGDPAADRWPPGLAPVLARHTVRGPSAAIEPDEALELLHVATHAPGGASRGLVASIARADLEPDAEKAR